MCKIQGSIQIFILIEAAVPSFTCNKKGSSSIIGNHLKKKENLCNINISHDTTSMSSQGPRSSLHTCICLWLSPACSPWGSHVSLLLWFAMLHYNITTLSVGGPTLALKIRLQQCRDRTLKSLISSVTASGKVRPRSVLIYPLKFLYKYL